MSDKAKPDELVAAAEDVARTSEARGPRAVRLVNAINDWRKAWEP